MIKSPHLSQMSRRVNNPMLKPHLSFVPVVALALLAAAHPAHAAFINGSFETGDFTGYSTIGNTSIQTASSGVTPTNGNNQALVVNNGVGVNTLATFFHISPNSINALSSPSPYNATIGAGFKQSFHTKPRSTVSFDYNFGTDEFTPQTAGYNDNSFFVFDGHVTKLADTFSNFGGGSNYFSSQTGYGHIRFKTGQGNHTLGFGAVNVGDTAVSSGVFVDNIRVSVAPVPELPTSVLMMIAVMMLMTIAGGQKLLAARKSGF